MTDKIRGKLKWFNESSSEDYFVHFSAIQTSGLEHYLKVQILCLK